MISHEEQLICWRYNDSLLCIPLEVKTMQDSFQRYLSAILESSDDDNGGDVLELTFDLQRLNINNLEEFQLRESEAEVQELIQEYRDR